MLVCVCVCRCVSASSVCLYRPPRVSTAHCTSLSLSCSPPFLHPYLPPHPFFPSSSDDMRRWLSATEPCTDRCRGNEISDAPWASLIDAEDAVASASAAASAAASADRGETNDAFGVRTPYVWPARRVDERGMVSGHDSDGQPVAPPERETYKERQTERQTDREVQTEK